MIDRIRLKRLLAVAAGFCLVAGLACLLAGNAPLAGGVALGFALGALPFATWAWVIFRGFQSARARALAVILLAAKMAVYAGALYLFVTRKLVSPAGVAIGVTAVVATISVGLLLGPSPAKEAS